MINLIDTYKPQKSTDFIGHFKFVNDFKNRLRQNNFNKLFFCIGETGIGKTDLLKTIFKELNYTYIEIINNDNLINELNNHINLKGIDSFFKKKYKKLIFIDDFEIFRTDKKLLNYIININNRNIPIVCVINKIYSRKFNEFKKKHEIYYIQKIGVDKCYKYIIEICSKENYNLNNKDLLNIKNFIIKNNSNLKYILINLNSLLKNSKNIIDYNEVDRDLYDSINLLLKNKFSILELEKIILNDSCLISMLLYENFTSIITKNKIKENQNYINSTKNVNNIIIEMYTDILEDICLSDKIEKNIYQELNWNYYGIMTLIKNFKLNHYYSKFNHDTFNKIKFTQILTKYSLRYNFNKKKIVILDENNISLIYFDYFIQNILLEISVNKNLIINENIDFSKKYNKEYIDILKKYNKEYNIIDNNILN